MISGEIQSIVENIDFTSKTELLNKLRSMRESAAQLPVSERRAVKEMLGVAIQEVYFTSGREVMRYKYYMDYKRKQGKKEAA